MISNYILTDEDGNPIKFPEINMPQTDKKMKSLESICKKYGMSDADFNQLLDIVEELKFNYSQREKMMDYQTVNDYMFDNKVSKQTVYDRIKTGKLQRVKILGRTLVKEK